jgi:hypothetical protein
LSIHKAANYLQVVLMWIHSRLTTRAGFETGSEISINLSLAKEDAEFLKRRNYKWTFYPERN